MAGVGGAGNGGFVLQSTAIRCGQWTRAMPAKQRGCVALVMDLTGKMQPGGRKCRRKSERRGEEDNKSDQH